MRVLASIAGAAVVAPAAGVRFAFRGGPTVETMGYDCFAPAGADGCTAGAVACNRPCIANH